MQTPVKGNHSFANNFTVNLHDFLQFLGDFLKSFDILHVILVNLHEFLGESYHFYTIF